MAWENTKNSANNISNTATTNWDTTFGVEITTDAETIKNNTVGSIENAGTALGNSLYSLGVASSGIFEGEQYIDVADAVTSASIDFLNQRLERLRSAWTTTTRISVKGLLNEVAPYCFNPSDALNLLSTRISSAVGYLLGVNGDDWGEIFSNLGTEYADSLMSDPTVLDSVSNLKSIQSVAQTMNTITQSIAVVNAILGVLEPAFPYLEIATNIGSIMMSGGSSAAEGSSRTVQVAQSLCQQLTSIAVKSIKEAVFNIKIQVPELLVGVIEQLSVREAVSAYTGDSNVLSFLNNIFDDQFYQETQMNLTWMDTINETINQYFGWSDEAGKGLINAMFEDSNGASMKAKFLTSLTKNFMINAVKFAQQKSNILPPSEIGWTTASNYESLENDPIASNFKSSISANAVEISLNKNLGESPITDEDSIRSISNVIYNAKYGI